MAKPPARKSTTKTANRGAPGGARAASGRPAGLFTWVAIGLVLVVIVVLVVIKVTSSSSPNTPTGDQPTSAAMVKELTQIPASVFNAVGVGSPAIGITAPTSLKNQPVLNWPDAQGVKRPTIFYFGAEYCPFCAAERWPMIIALSRFGTFSGLTNTQSSGTDLFKDTPTFSLAKATYTSKYINFFPVEFASNIPAHNKYGYTVLDKPTKAELALVDKYDNATYVPGLNGAGSIPFITINNKYLVVGASYSPSALENTTRDAIASGLNDSSDLLTKGIITSANLFTAAVCQATGDQPASVCTSTGVKAALKVLTTR
jgi:thiol-disulfide isomerase/thioredoxin